MADEQEPATALESKHVTISLKTVGSVVSAVVAILGSIWAIDSHYASAADVARMQQSMEYNVRQLRIEQTEDELFKLDAKKQAQGGRLEPMEQALHDRYVRRIRDARREDEKSLNLINKEK
jgi:hypothetical protein